MATVSDAVSMEPVTRTRAHSGGRNKAVVWLFALAAGITVVVMIAKSTLTGLASSSESLILHTVTKNDMEIVVVERGNLESANNVDLLCEIEARNPASPATSIKSIVSEGHITKKGELLVEFDSASIEDQLRTQGTTVEKAKAAVTTAEADLEIVRSQNESDINASKTAIQLAEIDLKRYLEGDFVKEKRKIDGDSLIANEELKRAKERVEYSEKLNKKGYVNSSEVQSDQLAVTRAENALAMGQEELRVLDKYTKPRQVLDLQSKRDEAKRALDRVQNQAKAKEATARAKYLAEKAGFETEQSTLRKLERQFQKCKLYAPIDGMVTYANEQGRWGQSQLQIEEGASVRERQKIIRIPDLTVMQINVKVHEAKVTKLFPGLQARVRVESMTEASLPGTVKSVATIADAQSWMSSGVQVFTVIVSIDAPVKGLKPGMTAEVEILASKVPGVLTVPVQAVIERKGQNFAYRKNARDFDLVPVVLGPSNDKQIAVTSGLNEGDVVVQNLSTVLSEAELRRLTESIEAAPSSSSSWAAAKAPPAAPETKFGPAASVSKDAPPKAGALGAATKETGKAAGKGARKGGSRDGLPATPADYIKSYDKNGDGKVAESEVPETARQFFSRLDTSGDGALDKTEVEAFYERMKSFRQNAGNSGPGGPGG